MRWKDRGDDDGEQWAENRADLAELLELVIEYRSSRGEGGPAHALYEGFSTETKQVIWECRSRYNNPPEAYVEGFAEGAESTVDQVDG